MTKQRRLIVRDRDYKVIRDGKANRLECKLERV
jgi:hypothetical protein